MANAEYGGRLILDTAEEVYAAGSKLRLLSVSYWSNTDVDDVILHDGNGKEIWKGTLGDVSVNGNNVGHTFGGDGIIVDGLDLDTIDGGILYVYLGKV